MTATTTRELEGRDARIEEVRRDVQQWNKYVNALLAAVSEEDDCPPMLGGKVESLRNKRDSLMTKYEALRRHQRSGWERARRDLCDAREEFLNSWRSVMATIDREGIFL